MPSVSLCVRGVIFVANCPHNFWWPLHFGFLQINFIAWFFLLLLNNLAGVQIYYSFCKAWFTFSSDHVSSSLVIWKSVYELKWVIKRLTIYKRCNQSGKVELRSGHLKLFVSPCGHPAKTTSNIIGNYFISLFSSIFRVQFLLQLSLFTRCHFSPIHVVHLLIWSFSVGMTLLVDPI